MKFLKQLSWGRDRGNRRTGRHTVARSFGVAIMASLMMGCGVNDLVKVDPATPEQVDSDVVRTYSGAIALYYGAINQAALIGIYYTLMSGLMTDELQSNGSSYDVDARTERAWLDGKAYPFLGIWPVLSATQRAIDALRQFPSQAPRSYIAELYALQGMAAVWIAEGYCSGVPLTKAPLNGNFQYTKGYTTTEVLQHAVALFDTALSFGVDSQNVVTLAKVGKGRAFLNLGEHDAAALVVSGVQTADRYLVYYINGVQENYLSTVVTGFRVINAEGANGLRWIAANPALQDPRVPLTTRVVGANTLFTNPARQAKYTGANNTLRLADGIEARLIEAEIALRANDSLQWMELLNELRASASSSIIPALGPDSTLLVSPAERLNVMFRERAYWLYLTGHRQGDLRRLIRQYGREVRNTYPTGDYPVPDDDRVFYGSNVTMATTQDEINRNPLYDGCYNHNP